MSVNLPFSSPVSSSIAISNAFNFDPVVAAGVGLSIETTTESSGDPVPIYRGISGGSFVYSVGIPPGGATFITIIGYK